jgi:hypothetical protein
VTKKVVGVFVRFHCPSLENYLKKVIKVKDHIHRGDEDIYEANFCMEYSD